MALEGEPEPYRLEPAEVVRVETGEKGAAPRRASRDHAVDERALTASSLVEELRCRRSVLTVVNDSLRG